MKPWKQQTQVIDRTPAKSPFGSFAETPVPAPNLAIVFECLYGSHKADLLHRGTAYCRSCYDERNRLGTLIS